MPSLNQSNELESYIEGNTEAPAQIGEYYSQNFQPETHVMNL